MNKFLRIAGLGLIVLISLIQLSSEAPSELEKKNVAPAVVDEGSSVKRPSRQSLLQDLEVEEDVADQKVTSEAVPDSGNKNKREEDEVVDQNLEMDIMESLASEIVRNVRKNEDSLESDVEHDSTLKGRSTKCALDGESCEENKGCCSGFCSWTRQFTCYTV